MIGALLFEMLTGEPFCAGAQGDRGEIGSTRSLTKVWADATARGKTRSFDDLARELMIQDDNTLNRDVIDSS